MASAPPKGSVIVRLNMDMDKILRTMDVTPERLMAELPAMMNDHGASLQHHVATDVAGWLSNRLFMVGHAVDPREVEGALDTHHASAGDAPQWSTDSNAHLFPYERWITERDEKVCPICHPRDGQLFSHADLNKLFPAHPSCRCHLEKASFGDLMTQSAVARMPMTLEEIVDAALTKAMEVF